MTVITIVKDTKEAESNILKIESKLKACDIGYEKTDSELSSSAVVMRISATGYVSCKRHTLTLTYGSNGRKWLDIPLDDFSTVVLL